MAEIRINSTGELKLYDSDDSNYVSFKSGGTVSSNVTWTLPTADGSSGQMLSTDGSGTLSWATPSSADPSSADGDSLGTASAEWSDLYLADGGIIYFGNDQDITLTHVADTGLTLNGTFTTANSMLINGSTPTLTIGDAGAEDTKIVFDGNAQDFHIGLDDSADDLVIGLGSTLGTTSHIVIDEAGHVTKPLQPAFMANKSASGQTPSANTATTVVFENEVFDNNADYNNSTYIFTAPVTGRYWFHTRIRVDQVGGGTGIYSVRLVSSNRTIHNTQVDLSDYLDGTMDRMTFTCTGLLDMDASDTCKVQVYEDSGYEIEDEVEETYFMGYLVC